MHIQFNLLGSQEELDVMIQNFDWSDSFIRESAYLSQAFINENFGIVHNEQSGQFRLLIFSQDEQIPGVELLFDQLIEININLEKEIYPIAVYKENYIEFNLHKDAGKIVANKMLYRYLNKELLGYKTLYSMVDFYDMNGDALFEIYK